ncbi:hypothetical protein [Candidatus Methanodesulfokora washburnensis]|uniref:Uncharacterized protein n=1 Tax=Candidatus Methanodesulfokora washburnensis TaxID=2478471 RepID=A0A429GFC1_9CREN|nr:hypothetical protein [Candidatus Methanodesulfokores washburnensis]RSN72440.1 hypothetical protein D6D85_13800 [Candidatus Methanodesulfokores washburnensis]
MPAASGRRTHISLQIDAGYAFLGFLALLLIIFGIIYPLYGHWSYKAGTQSTVLFGFSDGSVKEIDPVTPVQALVNDQNRQFVYVQLKTQLSGDYSKPFKVQYRVLARTSSDPSGVFNYQSQWLDSFTFQSMQDWQNWANVPGQRGLYTTNYMGYKGSSKYVMILPMSSGFYDKCYLLQDPQGDVNGHYTQVNCWYVEDWLRQKYSDGTVVELDFQVRVVDSNGNVIAGPVDASPRFSVKLAPAGSTTGTLSIVSVGTAYGTLMMVPTQSAVASGVTIINWTYIGILLCVLGIIYLAVFRKKRRRR